MKCIRNLSLSLKLTLAIFTTSTAALLVGGLAITGYELSTFESRALSELSTLAEIIGVNSTGALAFNDVRTSMDTLNALKDQPSIVCARLFNDKGQSFATYIRNGERQANLPSRPAEAPYSFSEGHLHLFRPIQLHGQTIGSVYLDDDLARVRERLWRYAGIVFLMIVLLIPIVLLISLRIQKIISRPILNLARVAQIVAERKEYTLRAALTGQDEITVLTQTFNQMLDAIQGRDTALLKSNTALQIEIVERNRTEAALESSRRRLELAQVAGRIGSFDWDLPTGRITWTSELEALYGLPIGSFQGTHETWMKTVHPDDVDTVEIALTRAINEKKEFYSEYRIVWPDQTVHWIAARGQLFFEGEAPKRMLGINMDITERKTFEQKLIQQAEELWRSNKELEQFAYVSSHDLQEPLRKISSYAQLISVRYKNQLDADADKYIASISNGVTRMHNLIQDLLAYSKISQPGVTLQRVDLNQAVDQAVSDLETSIRELGASVTHDPLPVVNANASQMQQLLQNLIANGIKFHRAEPPHVHISAATRGDGWEISVADNGIGIDPKYHEQIFKVFQRLHGRDKYPGTGIGLAICKKIIERHGGEIRVNSRPDGGAVFSFTLPARVEAPAA